MQNFLFSIEMLNIVMAFNVKWSMTDSQRATSNLYLSYNEEEILIVNIQLSEKKSYWNLKIL